MEEHTYMLRGGIQQITSKGILGSFLDCSNGYLGALQLKSGRSKDNRHGLSSSLHPLGSSRLRWWHHSPAPLSLWGDGALPLHS
jgi:hypothetical protein